jgi:hypothetical protein
MLLVAANKSKKLLTVRFIGSVGPAEFSDAQADLVTELAGLSPGFRHLADFSQLESMEMDCSVEIGAVMELIAHAGVALVVRVIPDASKDIGMNILSIFHYPRELPVVTCQNLAEAAKALKLS